MPSEAHEETLVDEPPTSIDPYAVLEVEKTATDEEVKKAYRKAALRNHPDKVPGDQKEVAHAKFQEIAFAYAILSDPRRRKRYDTTGRTEETLDLDDDDFDWSSFFKAQFENVITEESIRKIREEYKGSEEEHGQLLDAYRKFKGDMNKMYEVIMLSNPLEDEERFASILDAEIAAGNLEECKKYTQESEASKKRRMDNARKEAEEAEELQAEMESEKKGKSGQQKNAKKNKKAQAVSSEASLAALIQQRQKARGEAFFDKLEEKYAPKGKKRSQPMDEPPEEAFLKTAEKAKKSKSSKAAKGTGERRSKRTKH